MQSKFKKGDNVKVKSESDGGRMTVLGCNNINELKNSSIMNRVIPIYSCKIIEPSGEVFINNFPESMLEKIN